MVLVVVHASEQMSGAVFITDDLRIVPCCDIIRTQFHRIIQESFEFDFLVAHDIRIRRPALLIFVQEILEDLIPVFLFEIDGIIRNADLLCDSLNILVIFRCRTESEFIRIIPILHENADDVVTLFLQKQCCDRRVNTTAHSDHHAYF